MVFFFFWSLKIVLVELTVYAILLELKVCNGQSSFLSLMLLCTFLANNLCKLEE